MIMTALVVIGIIALAVVVLVVIGTMDHLAMKKFDRDHLL